MIYVYTYKINVSPLTLVAHSAGDSLQISSKQHGHDECVHLAAPSGQYMYFFVPVKQVN
jgi:hypothetical protein